MDASLEENLNLNLNLMDDSVDDTVSPKETTAEVVGALEEQVKDAEADEDVGPSSEWVLYQEFKTKMELNAFLSGYTHKLTMTHL
jgi:hypothetical protein